MIRKLLLALTCLFWANVAHAQGVLVFGGPPPSGSPIGAGVDFTAATTPLFAPSAATLQFSGAFSISAWFKGSFSGGVNPIIVSSLTATTGYTIFNRNSGDLAYPLQFIVRPASGATSTCGTAGNNRACTRATWINDGNWHLITTTWDGTYSRIYIDAQLRDQSSGTAYVPTLAAWQVGTSLQPFLVRDARVYTKTLSNSDIGVLFAFGQANVVPTSGALSTDMAAYWPLDACSPSCPDATGNGNTLTQDTTPPSAAVTVPSAAAVLSGAAVTMTATATDAAGVASVTFYVDGTQAGLPDTSSPYTISFDSTKLTDGAHTIYAVATDIAGNTGQSATVNVTSSNSVTAKNYYFSTAGSDSNNCLSSGASCKTITKANTFTYHENDVRHWNGGDTFTGCLTLNGGINLFSRADQPFTDTSYGSGHALITPNCTGTNYSVGAVNVAAGDGYVWDGVDITGDSGGLAKACILLYNSDSVTPHGNITIENSTFQTCAAHDTYFGAYVFTDSTWYKIIDVNILNNDMHGASGPTSTDDNCVMSYGASATIIGYGLIQGNLCYDVGGKSSGVAGSEGSGIVFAGSYTGTALYNVVHDIAANRGTCGDAYGIWGVFADNYTITQNEVYNVGALVANAGCDKGGYDIDQTSNNAIVERNYAHHNYGSCVLLFRGGTWNNHIVRWNVCEGNDTGQTSADPSGELTLTGASSIRRVDVYNNDFISNTSTAYAVVIYNGNDANCVAAASIWANNDIEAKNSSGVVNLMHWGQGFSFTPSCIGPILKNNNYWSTTGTGTFKAVNGASTYSSLSAWETATGETGGMNVNPLWTSPYTNQACNNTTSGPAGAGACPSAYVTGATSPLKQPAGADISATTIGTSMGTKDYYGNSLPCSGGGYPIGASCH